MRVCNLCKESLRHMEKINVQLYGDGKTYPLSSETIECDKCKECSFYKDNLCLNVQAPFSSRCKFGKVITAKGYTKRSAKYWTFRSKYEKDEKYGKLKYPYTRHCAIIDNMLYLNLIYCKLERMEEQNIWTMRSTLFSTPGTYIPLCEVNDSLLHLIFSNKPRSLMGSVITDYSEKILPDLLLEFKSLIPSIINSFLLKYPEFDYKPNYIGKRAYINSFKPGTRFEIKGVEWIYDGEFVITNGFDIGIYSPWFMENSKSETIKLKVTPKMTVEINDNSIIDEDTRFE